MKKLIVALALAASPVFAAEGEPFFSLRSTEFVVTLGFLLFIAVLLKYKIPGLLLGLLDKRAAGIRADLDEARALRDAAQLVLASYERKQKQVQEQSQRIVASARDEAMAAAAKAGEDLKLSIARRVKAAEEQIASAEASAVREVRDRAIVVAIAAAGDLIGEGLTAGDSDALIDQGIALVDARMH